MESTTTTTRIKCGCVYDADGRTRISACEGHRLSVVTRARDPIDGYQKARRETPTPTYLPPQPGDEIARAKEPVTIGRAEIIGMVLMVGTMAWGFLWGWLVRGWTR